MKIGGLKLLVGRSRNNAFHNKHDTDQDSKTSKLLHLPPAETEWGTSKIFQLESDLHGMSPLIPLNQIFHKSKENRFRVLKTLVLQSELDFFL